MANSRSHALHQGEQDLQRRRHTPEELTRELPNYIQTEMPQQHAEFYSGLSYLSLCTMDKHGRPWASILVTQSDADPSIGINVSQHNGLNIIAQMNPHDPFFRAVEQTNHDAAGSHPLFAGVGVDFSNRRRNKIAGSIDSAVLDTSGKMHLQLNSDEHLGNCPKYITVRSLQTHPRVSELVFDNFDALEEPLTDSAKELINQASTVFLATKHVPNEGDTQQDQADMGLNHRGGSPGFVRVYEEIEEPANQAPQSKHSNGRVTTYLVLPDYSGNRFYQSLGNIQSSQRVGLVFPDFKTGNMLYATGEAENLFDEDADTLMPRMTLVTRIRLTGAVLIQEALSLRMQSDEQLSPYNPPLRYLRNELEEMGHTNNADAFADDPISATLVASRKQSSTVRTFSFQLSRSIQAPLPGGFGVFDFSEVLDAGYSHMDEVNPQAVNEDYIRTWTLSSAPEFDFDSQQFKPVNMVDVTVKHQPNGLISGFLHRASAVSGDRQDQVLQLAFKGTGGGFSCFEQGPENKPPSLPTKMLWVVGGVGITPFMSMWDGIRNINQMSPQGDAKQPTDIVLVFGGRDDDLQLLRHFLNDAETMSSMVSLNIIAYQSGGREQAESNLSLQSLTEDFPNATLKVLQGRINPADLAAIDNVFEREAFLCGPDGLMRATQDWLQANGGGSQKIHQESYFF